MKGIITLFFIAFLSINLISCNSNQTPETNTNEQIEKEIDQALETNSTEEQTQNDLKDTEEEDQKNKETDEKQPEEQAENKPSIDEQISEVMQNTTEDSPQLKNNGNAKKGKELFMNTCASCHGMKGVGDGVAAVSLDPKPRDLSDKDYVSGLSDNHLFRVISLGGVSVGKSALMPPWGGILSEEEIWNVISHLRKNVCNCSYIEPAEEN